MRSGNFAWLCVLGVVLSGCSSSIKEAQAVKTTYIHRYGVKVIDEKDFFERGGTGEVVQTLRDGSTLRKTYVNGTIEGKVFQTFPHSEVVHRVQVYANGVLKEEIENYPSSVPMVKTEFIRDGATNTVQKTYWFEDGSPRASERIVNNVITKAEYFTPLFELESSIENGNGTKVVRDASGLLIRKEKYVASEKVSETRFHLNGVISEEFSLFKGRIDGIKKTFTITGAPRTIEEWKSGEIHGTVTFFEKGEKVAVIPYEHGKKHGIEKQYKPGSEVVIAETSWIYDQKHGPQVTIVDDMRIVDWFFNDEKISRSEYIDRSSHAM